MYMLRNLLVFFFTISYLSLLAQVYNVTGYSTNQDLHSQVISVHQDREGFLWFGTHGGLFRFDGNEFLHFDDEHGVPGTFLRGILEDREGMLWLATDNGLSRFDGKTFTNFGTEEGLPATDLTTLMEDRHGNLWIGTQDKGIFRYDGTVFTAIALASPDPADYPNVKAIVEDTDGMVWIGTLDGLYTLHDGSEVVSPANIEGVEGRAEVYCLLEDRDGYMWLGTNRGLFRFREGKGKEIQLSNPKLSDKEVHCIVEDEEGQLWMGTKRGIFRYVSEKIIPLETTDRFLDYHMLSAIIDSEGNIWFGTDGGGTRKITVGVFESYGMQDRLSSNLAKSFLQDDEGNIWIATRDRGINVWDVKQKAVLRQYAGEDGLGGEAICSSFEDANGHFWFASYNGTLSRYDGTGFHIYGRREGLDCDAAYVIREDHKGRIWVGTDNGIFIKEGDQFSIHYQTSDGLVSNIVYSLLLDHQNRMWIGTTQGICRWESGEFNCLEEDEGVGENVFTLVEDRDHRVWVGSSTGLEYIEKDKPQRIRISGAKGADIVVSLMLENDTALWIGTENGAYSLNLNTFRSDPGNFHFNHFTRKDGLPSLECNAQAAFQDSKGNIWMGTSEGAILSPVGTPRERKTKEPPIYITEVIGARGSRWDTLGYDLDERELPTNLVLPYSENRLEFEFIAISLKSPKQIEYKYILEGLNGFDEWSRSVREPRILFPNLPAGEYTFKITAKREAESWNYDYYESFSFKVLPPFWASWWFLVSIGMILIVSGIGVYQIIMTRRKERQIRNRAEMLQLEHQALYAMMNPHFTFNALQSIQYFIHRQDKKAANKFLSSFAKLIRKNLESTKVDFISLGEEIERLRLYLSLEKMRFPEKFDYQVVVEPGIELSETQIPPMLLQPFVENSIKHGIMGLDKDGMIQVEVSRYGQEFLEITIEDNGIGIEASKARKKDRPSDHVSKGMQITLDRLALFAKMTGKQYSLDIQEGKNAQGEVSGTIVKMILPVKTDQTILVVD